MKLKIIVLLVYGLSIVSYGQVPKSVIDFGLNNYSIKDSILGTIDFYVTKMEIEKRKPLLLFLDGSGHYPLYSLITKNDHSEELHSSIPLPYSKLAKNYHVVLISKPGTPFLDSLKVNSYEEFIQVYQPSQEYNNKLSLDWRVNSASEVIDYLYNNFEVDKSKIVVVGYSEGGQTVSKLATRNNKITKIVNIVGGSLNQFNDFIVLERLRAQKGIISADSAQANIDNLLLKFRDIYKHPKSTNKFWMGHTYKRWASFCNDIPLDNLLDLEIPILMVSGGNDTNSPITGKDYVELEFIRHMKTNLTYKVYPNCDHFFNDQLEKRNRLNEMLDYVIDWIEN